MKTKIYHDDYHNVTLWESINIGMYFVEYWEKEDKTQNNILIPIESVAKFIEKFLADRTNLLNKSVTDNVLAYLDKNDDKSYNLSAFKLVELINEFPATLIEPLNFHPSVTFDDKDFFDTLKCVKYIAEMARKGNGDAIQMLCFLSTGKKGTNDIGPIQLDTIKKWDDDYLDFLTKIAEKNLFKLFELADKANLIKQV
jgi:hypothetical protein